MMTLPAIDVNTIMAYFAAHPNHGMLLAYGIAFVESLAVVGSFIPGSVTMPLVGTMIGMGSLDMPITLFLIWLGALSGDYLSYHIGVWSQRYEPWLKRWKFMSKMMHHGQNLFRRHGKKAVVIGRFVSISRSMVPMVAGLLHMQQRPFILAAIMSALLWTLVFTLPGVAIGMYAITLPQDAINQFFAVVFGAILIMVVLGVIWQPIMIACNKVLTRASLLVARVFTRHKIAYGVYEHSPEVHRHIDSARYALLATLGFCGFAIIAHCYVDLGHFVSINHAVYTFMLSIHSVSLEDVLIVFTILAEKFAILGFFTMLAWICFCQREYKTALAFFGYGAFVFIAGLLIKHGFHILRPPLYMAKHGTHSFSFPSGHSLLSVAILGAPILIADVKQKVRHSLWVSHTLFVLFVMISRLFVGAHWLSDVTAGALLGYSMLGLFASLREGLQVPRISGRTLAMAYGGWFLFCSAFNYQFWTKNKLYYALPDAFAAKVAGLSLVDAYEYVQHYLNF